MSLPLLGAGLSADSVSAPTNTVAPAISGTPKAGNTLTCTPGSYTGSPTITRQWKSFNSDGANDISGETGLTLLVPSDIGAGDPSSGIRCHETATNAAGSVEIDSNDLGPITTTTVTFAYTGTDQAWTVPAGVTKVTRFSCGGAGQAAGSPNASFGEDGGYGGYYSSLINFSVTPADSLNVTIDNGAVGHGGNTIWKSHDTLTTICLAIGGTNAAAGQTISDCVGDGVAGGNGGAKSATSGGGGGGGAGSLGSGGNGGNGGVATGGTAGAAGSGGGTIGGAGSGTGLGIGGAGAASSSVGGGSGGGGGGVGATTGRAVGGSGTASVTY